MSLKSIAALYLREYPALIRKVDRLRALVRTENPNCALLALFGSVPRFEPRAASDADLLVLTHQSEDGLGVPTHMSALVIAVEDWSDESACAWPFSMVVGDANASDLDSDFLGEVARDGVLLYLQDGVRPPEPLTTLRSYDEWLRQVEVQLAECRAVLALPEEASTPPEAAVS
jgi:hypothetical protein